MWKNIYKKIEKKKYNRQEVLLIKSLHVWDFYRRNDILISQIEIVLDFLDVSECAMDIDVLDIVNRFISDLSNIQEFLRNCNALLNRDTSNDHLDNFGSDLRDMLNGLYTTLCSVHTCATCAKK